MEVFMKALEKLEVDTIITSFEIWAMLRIIVGAWVGYNIILRLLNMGEKYENFCK